MLRVQVRKLRDNTDPFQIPEERFIEIFRLNKEVANELLNEISPFMKSGMRITFIPKTIRLAAALNFYAKGSYQREIGQDFVCPMSKTMICRIIKEVSLIIQDKLMNKYVKFPTAAEEQDQLKERFFSHTGFPGVIGAIDCMHVKIKKPASNVKYCYRNRKGFFSKNIQLVSDVDLNILGCYARFGGSTEDAYIFEKSRIKEYLENRHNREKTSKNWLIGDIAYPLQPWLMTPYRTPENDGQQRFNDCHAKARNCVVRLQAVLKNVFACLSQSHGLLVDPSFSGVIINVCCTLHNFRKLHNFPAPDVTLKPENETEDAPETSNLDNNSLFYAGSEIRDNIVRTYFEA